MTLPQKCTIPPCPYCKAVIWVLVVLTSIFGAGYVQITEVAKTSTENDKAIAVILNDLGYIKRGIDNLQSKKP
jgi:hypothetical protein